MESGSAMGWGWALVSASDRRSGLESASDRRSGLESATGQRKLHDSETFNLTEQR
jgi:hypothetical protein